MLLRRFNSKIYGVCHLFISSLPVGHGITFDEFYSLAIESLYLSMKHYDDHRKVSFYTYAMNTINKELIRYFVKNSVHDSPNLSFSQLSKEEGLAFEELFGYEDEKIKKVFVNNEIRESINDGIFSNDEFNQRNVRERIHLLMLELTGQNNLSRKEISNLKRRIKYWINKKSKDND